MGEKEVFVTGKTKELALRQEFTPYQIQRILGFFSDKNPKDQFSAFNGFLTAEEKEIFKRHVEQFLTSEGSITINVRGDCLPEILKSLNVPKALAQKITDYCCLHIISQTNWDQDSIADVDSLPLPVYFSLKTLGRNAKEQMSNFLKEGGIMTIFSFKKPPNFYLQAIDNLPEGTLQEKISLVLSGKANGKTEEASHQFIVVDLIPQEPYEQRDFPNNPYHLRKLINERLDKKYERDYANLLLMAELLSGHMEEVKISLLAMGGLAGFFYFLDQLAKGQTTQEIYFGFQALVKVTTHLLANLVDFYSQHKLILKGENFFSQIRDLVRKFGWREAFIFANGGLMDLLSEYIGEIDFRLGSIVFGAEPVLGTGLTTLAGSHKISNNESFIERVKVLIENPAVLGMNTAAFLTFLTSVGLLGIAGEFHNPLAVVLVGGVSEPIYACLVTELFMRRKLKRLKNKLKGD